MKDYTLYPKEHSHFITEVFVDQNGTYTVVFSDGRCLRNVEVSEENLAKIKDAQEKQAEEGIKNLRVFVSRKNKAGLLSAFSSLVAAGAMLGSTYIPTVGQTFNDHPVLFVAGVGVITILGMIPGRAKMKKNDAIIQELHKIKYRNDHRRKLDQFRSYPNALEGLQSRSALYTLSHDDDPFSVINMDDFTEDDFRVIVSNIEREDAFQFTYDSSRRNASSK